MNSTVYFNCLVIKGKISICETERPSTFIKAEINGREIFRTKYAFLSYKPKWNQNFMVEAQANDSIKFVMFRILHYGNSMLLAEESIPVSEIVHQISRFNFGLMRKSRLRLKPVDPTSNRSSFIIYFGWSRRRSISGNLQNASVLPMASIEDFVGDRSANNGLTNISSRNVHLSELNISNIDNYEHIALEEHDNELPFGWERRTTNSGVDFYVDHNTHITQWERPRPLPPGWEARLIVEYNRVFYRNTVEGTNTWHRPTPESILQHRSLVNAWLQRRSGNRDNFHRLYHMNSIDHGPSGNQTLNDDQISHVIDCLLGPLPDNVECRLDEKSQSKFFVDHNNKTCSWEDPRMSWLNSDGFLLSKDVDIRCNQFGIPYFIDHHHKKTSFLDPRNGMPIFPSAVLAMRYKNTFREKMIYFRNLCRELTKEGTTKLVINRQNLINDSMAEVTNLTLEQLHKHLFIQFKREEGLDYGGLSREWMYEISHEILNPEYCLFITRGSNSDYIFEINPLSSIIPNFKQYYNFVGRIIGLALFHAKFLDCSFSNIFYKKILNQPCILEDIQQIDVEFYNSIKWISKNNIEEAQMEIFFCTEIEYFGELKVIELKPNGQSIQVTEANKDEYIKLLVDWKINFGTREQMKCVLIGISEIIPLTWFRCFSIKEFEMLLCGIQDYDVEDWRQHTKYKGYDEKSLQIIWFWKFVENLKAEERGKLLHFVTGTTRVPPTGFQDLMGSNGIQRFCIEKWGNENDLPRSHTCFNRLDLPPYQAYEDLQSKVLTAIHEGCFFLQE